MRGAVYRGTVAPRASGLGAWQSPVHTCRWRPWQELTGVILDPSLYRGAFQDFSLFVYICMYVVLTFQPWMVLYISVNCLLFL